MLDLVEYLYFLALDIREIDRQSEKPAKQTRIVNIYDNQVRQRYIWERDTL